MSRRMIGPGVWIDEGPQSGRTQGWQGVVPGILVGSDRPSTLTLGEQSVGHVARRRQNTARRRRSPHVKICLADCTKKALHRGACGAPPVVCAHPMKIAKEPCARRSGHAPPHMTRTGLDRMNFIRNSPRRKAA